jgi:LmbE family N-acetylglucosaminyl deacetylase
MNVLVLAAHPDDETLGAGATIAKLSDQGCNVKLLTFTDGEGARGPTAKNRNNKLDKVCEILGIREYECGSFPDNQMDAVPLLEICKFIEKNATETPDIILTHHPECLNIDHSLVHRAALTVFRPQRGEAQDILGFYVPSSTDYNPNLTLRSNTYIDVTGYEDVKIKALRVYDEEMRDFPHTRSYENVSNLMKVWGAEVGLSAAEKFYSARRILK